MPQAVTNNAVVSVRTEDNEYLVSFAGLGAGKSHDDTLDVTWVFNGNLSEWAEAAPVPGGVGRLAAVAVEYPGKLADFVILERDPHEVDPDNIVNIKILKTVLGGRTTFEA